MINKAFNDHHKRVLVVDDDVMLRLLARETLEQAGFLVDEAANGKQAIIEFERSKPELIFLDVMMPDCNGLDICTQIREHPEYNNAAIIIMTGLHDFDSIHRAYKAGATDFIIKPINWTVFGYRANFIATAKQASDQVRYLAMFDSLTNLPNRVLLLDRLGQAVHYAARYNKMFAVLFIDLDFFKQVNDTLGHDIGDLLLKQVAQRMLLTTRSSDTLARLGGDEFILVIQDVASPEAIQIVVQLFMEHFSKPFKVDSHDIYLTASIGIAIYPSDGTTSSDLIKNADIAMNHSKKIGKNDYRFFSFDMQNELLQRITIEKELRKAIDSNEFVLHYQPRIESVSGQVVGMEALVRWAHPERGLILPEEFISISEEIGLIVPLGEWVLREACSQTKEWIQTGCASLKVSVNVSPVQFLRGDVLGMVKRILEETGLPPAHLEIEITESTLMQLRTMSIATKPDSLCNMLDRANGTQSDLITILQSLRAMGVSIALDDFGTGYSSLSYLNIFPIDVLKIDRSFINVIDESTDSPIITAIIAMADKLMLHVVAEGVETTSQKDYLISNGCDELQGYLLGRPVIWSEFIKTLGP